MKEQVFWKFIVDRLSARESVILMIVVEYEKGSPGKTGFKMAVTLSETAGTVGGGIMEFNLLTAAREFIASQQQVRIVKKLIHNMNTSAGEASGLNCAGSQTIGLLSLSTADIDAVMNIRSSLHSNAPAHFSLDENGMSFHHGKRDLHNSFQSLAAGTWSYHENVGSEYSVYIIGGGHVGLATAKVLQTLDFSITIFDERQDAPAMNDDSLTLRRIVTPFEEIGRYIEESEKNFIAIVTSAMQSDRTALQSIIKKKLGYIGIMGTEAKIARIVNSFSSEEKKVLAKIHAPIGIDIGSRSVEEIAVSIAAEMVKEKNIG